MHDRSRFFFVLKRCCLLCIIIVLIQSLWVQTVYSQDELNRVRTMWQGGLYSEVVPLLIEYRESMTYGRNLEIDYMIANSLCHIPELQKDGYDFLQYILQNYDLDDVAYAIIENEMHRYASGDTGPSNTSGEIVDILLVISHPRGTSYAGSVRGKMFHDIPEGSAIASDPTRVVREIPPEEFTERLFKVSNTESSMSHMRERLGSEFEIQSFGHFVIASCSLHTWSQLQDIGENMEKVLRFFESRYQMPIPSHLVSVYLVPDSLKLLEFAEEIHGIEVSSYAIGYSFQNDLSVVGVIPYYSVYIGTLAHELFHLMVRNRFGDIPPWLDEGIASLYEVLQITEDGVIGLPNWRGKLLARLWSARPSIEELVRMNWRSFNNIEGNYEVEQQAVNHATARYFMLFLQEKQKLIEVYGSFRDRKATDIPGDPAADSVQLLETILGQPLAEVDEGFEQWFRQLH